MDEKRKIESMADLCDFFCADVPAMLNKRIYKGTDCGASISVQISIDDPWGSEDPAYLWVHNGMGNEWNAMTRETPILSFTIQTIVEGSDATVDSEPFVLPVKTEDVDQWIDFMETEAKALWDEANLHDEDELIL